MQEPVVKYVRDRTPRFGRRVKFGVRVAGVLDIRRSASSEKRLVNCLHERLVHVYVTLVSGKVLCGGQQTLSIQCRGGNLSGKRFELRAAENWAGAPLPRFSTMRDAHRPVRF